MGLREEILEEDRYRAQFYRLLARLLARAPDQEALAIAAGLEGDGSEMGAALNALAAAASSSTRQQIDDEFHDLFIGVGRGELVPFGSFYMTGFLNEKPLARLREDMAQLGVARADGVSEPEDHIASVCDIMAGLILGAFGEPVSLARQATFFDRHIAPWGTQFFEDLETADAADFYKPVGTVGRVFLGIEATAFQMAA